MPVLQARVVGRVRVFTVSTSLLPNERHDGLMVNQRGQQHVSPKRSHTQPVHSSSPHETWLASHFFEFLPQGQ